MQEESIAKPWLSWAVRAAALALTLAALVFASGPAGAAAAGSVAGVGDMVYPLGRAVGIKLFADGVMVVGLSEVDTAAGSSAPAKSCGLREGDIITHINSEEVGTIEEVQSILQDLEGKSMSIRARRDGEELQVTAQAVQCASDGSYKLGAWIRDSMAGIGTMTFYDPASGVFAALGHGINDVDTAMLMPLESGNIMRATVSDVKKGLSGQPGELHGQFDLTRDMGSLYANTDRGIFGQLDQVEGLTAMEPVEVASKEQVHTGAATILSNVRGDEIEEFDVEITHISSDADGTRSLMLRVNDPELLQTTGGIVQGMSGSPILQDGRLVGAVTHVLVNDPTRGYGILAQTMCKAAQCSET